MYVLRSHDRRAGLPRIAFDSPTKNKHAGASEFIKQRGPLFDLEGRKVFQQEINEYFGLSHATSYRNIASNDQMHEHRHQNEPEVRAEKEQSPSPCEAAIKRGDHRGRKILLSHQDIKRIDRYIQRTGWDSRCMSWSQLA